MVLSTIRRVLVQVFVPEIIVGCPMGVLDGFVVVGQPLGRIKTFSVAEMFGNVGEKQGLGAGRARAGSFCS